MCLLKNRQLFKCIYVPYAWRQHRLCVRFTAKNMLGQPVSAAGFEGLKFFFFFFKEKTRLLYGVINWNNSWEHQVSAPQIVHGGSEEATAHNLSPFFALGLLESEAGSTSASVLLS